MSINALGSLSSRGVFQIGDVFRRVLAMELAR